MFDNVKIVLRDGDAHDLAPNTCDWCRDDPPSKVFEVWANEKTLFHVYVCGGCAEGLAEMAGMPPASEPEQESVVLHTRADDHKYVPGARGGCEVPDEGQGKDQPVGKADEADLERWSPL